MTLAVTTLAPIRRGRIQLARVRLGLDAALLAAAVGVCAVLLFDGGLEALIGASLGVAFGRKTLVQSAFGGLFAGAIFAGFFHNALASLFSFLF